MVWQKANKEKKSFLTLNKKLRVGKELNIVSPLSYTKLFSCNFSILQDELFESPISPLIIMTVI